MVKRSERTYNLNWLYSIHCQMLRLIRRRECAAEVAVAPQYGAAAGRAVRRHRVRQYGPVCVGRCLNNPAAM